MKFERYSLILKRWLPFLLAVSALAALACLFFFTRVRPNSDPTGAVVLAALAALAWGAAGVFGIEWLVDSVKTESDVRNITSLPLLGTVVTTGKSDAPLLDGLGRDAIATEAYLIPPREDTEPWGAVERPRLVTVCATQPTMHAARVAASLAASSASSGTPTLLVDGTRGEGSLSIALGLDKEPGLSDALNNPGGEVVLRRVNSLPSLFVLPSGTQGVSDSRTYSPTNVRALVERAGVAGGLAVVVAPPAGAQASIAAVGLAMSADDVVLVAVADDTRRRALRAGVDALRKAGANLGGVVFVQKAPSASARLVEAVMRRVPRSLSLPVAPPQKPPRSLPAPPEREGWVARKYRLEAEERARQIEERRRAEAVSGRKALPASSQNSPYTPLTARQAAALQAGKWPVRDTATASPIDEAPREPLPAEPVRAPSHPAPPQPVPPGEPQQAQQETQNGSGDTSGTLIGLWLYAAERAHRKGDAKEAKKLIDHILDYEPHNEAAWELRLRITSGDTGGGVESGGAGRQEKANMRHRRGA